MPVANGHRHGWKQILVIFDLQDSAQSPEARAAEPTSPGFQCLGGMKLVICNQSIPVIVQQLHSFTATATVEMGRPDPGKCQWYIGIDVSLGTTKSGAGSQRLAPAVGDSRMMELVLMGSHGAHVQQARHGKFWRAVRGHNGSIQQNVAPTRTFTITTP